MESNTARGPRLDDFWRRTPSEDPPHVVTVLRDKFRSVLHPKERDPDYQELPVQGTFRPERRVSSDFISHSKVTKSVTHKTPVPRGRFFSSFLFGPVSPCLYRGRPDHAALKSSQSL